MLVMKHFKCIIVLLSFLFPGCNYLDTVPKNDVETVETIFEKRTAADDWLKTCYLFLSKDQTSLPRNPAMTGTDEIVAGDFCRQYFMNNNWTIKEWVGFSIADGLQMSQEPYGNVWKRDLYYAGIRYCNIFIEKIGGTYNMEDSEKRLWTAEVKALKAQYYFELMRRYGPIILVPQNIDVNTETSVMQQPRSPIDEVVNAIITLLDEALEVLPSRDKKDMMRWAYHSRESAASLKAMTLFYAASPLFNGNPAYAGFTNKEGKLLFPTEDKEKWKRAAEAIDEAIRICTEECGRELVSGNIGKTTKLLNTMADIENSTLAMNFQNKEALMMFHTDGNTSGFWSKWTLPYVNSDDVPYFHYENMGCIAPSMKMVEMYYTENGLPIDADKQWDYTSRYRIGREDNPEYKDVVSFQTNDVLELHLRREPRFYAHIAADRCYWQRGNSITSDMIVKAHRGERYGTKISTINISTPQNLTGYYMKKGTYSNVSNKDYSTVFNREEATILIRLADLYLMAAEAWNEYLEKPDNRVYDPLNKVRKRAGIPDVETSWKNYSKTPGKVDTKVGMREIIRQEWNIEFAFEGRRFWNLRRWLTAADELNEKQYGWNILGQTAQQFYNNFEGPIVVWSKRKFVAPRDYLFPLRSEEVLISGCVQNPGW